MPWKGAQAQAIFLQKARELGSKEKAAAWMRRHGNTGNALMDAHRKNKGKR